MNNQFYGHDLPYWIELEKQAQLLNVVHLLEELAAAKQRAYIAEGKLADIQRILETPK